MISAVEGGWGGKGDVLLPHSRKLTIIPCSGLETSGGYLPSLEASQTHSQGFTLSLLNSKGKVLGTRLEASRIKYRQKWIQKTAKRYKVFRSEIRAQNPQQCKRSYMIPQVINKRNQNVFYVSREITRENGENTAKKSG